MSSNAFDLWLIAIAVTVTIICACYLTAMWLIPDKMPKRRKRPWWWEVKKWVRKR